MAERAASRWMGKLALALLVFAVGACTLPRQGTVTPSVALSPQAVTAALPTRAATPVAGSTGGAPAGVTPTPTVSHCKNAAAPGSPIDVTVPDDTAMRPGQVFTKVWQIVNVGTCTWTPDYRIVWFSGARLGAAAAYPLGRKVKPGEAVNLAVDMVAPLSPGVYQSYWKLSTPDGTLFGIGQGAGTPFWVRIVVVSRRTPLPTPTPTITPPPTATPTATSSPTPTPPVQASGRVDLTLGDGLEVDGEKASATDILFLQVGNAHVLRPQDAARWGIFGSLQPSLNACRHSARSAADIPVDSLAVGTYLCYRSSDGHIGYARLEAVNTALWKITLSYLTWAEP